MSTIKVTNPLNGELIQELERHSEDQVMAMLDRAYARYQKRDLLPKARRVEILKKFQQIVESRKDQLIEQALLEGGKPYKDSLVEVNRGINGIDVAIEEINRQAGHEIPMNVSASSANRMAITFHRPRGVVLAISAFNHPFNLIIHQVIPAVAAGCPVLVKPASTTPLSCKSIVEMLHEAGLDQDLCHFILPTNDVAEKLIASPKTSFLTFIGSARVGWHLKSLLSPGATCALEHGGVAPVIIDEGTDLNNCCDHLVKGGFYHAGQVCVSVQRIFVHSSLKAEFTEKMLQRVKQLKTGDQKDKDTDVGPLISNKECDRVHEWVEEAKGKGANILCGGEKISASLYAPTIVTDAPKDCMLMTHEVFGPVVVINSYDNFDSAIDEANSLNVAFQAAVWTPNLDRAMKATRNLEATAVMINDHTAFRVDWMPFGGYKESGQGFGGIGYSIEEMSVERMMVIKSPEIQL